MEKQLVIYKLGEIHIQTTITNGYADFTGEKRPEMYLNELGPRYACLPIDQAGELIEKAKELKFIRKIKKAPKNYLELIEACKKSLKLLCTTYEDGVAKIKMHDAGNIISTLKNVIEKMEVEL